MWAGLTPGSRRGRGREGREQEGGGGDKGQERESTRPRGRTQERRGDRKGRTEDGESNTGGPGGTNRGAMEERDRQKYHTQGRQHAATLNPFIYYG